MTYQMKPFPFSMLRTEIIHCRSPTSVSGHSRRFCDICGMSAIQLISNLPVRRCEFRDRRHSSSRIGEPPFMRYERADFEWTAISSYNDLSGRHNRHSGANRLERGFLGLSTANNIQVQTVSRSRSGGHDRGRPEGSFGLRAQANLLNAIKLVLSVQSYPKKYSRFRHPQISTTNPAVSFRTRGVGHRHERWDGMRWTRQRRARAWIAGLGPLDFVSDRPARRTNGAALSASQKLRRGCTIRRSYFREDGSRTAKPCGPGTRCWCQVGGGFCRPDRSCKAVNPPMTVTRANSSPGRVRHKP